MTLYTILPLKWVRISDDRWVADSPVGRFVVRFNGCGWEWYVIGQTVSVDCDSIDDGKAKAEAYYRERLMGALEPVPVFPAEGSVIRVGKTEVRRVFPLEDDAPEPDHDRPPNCERP